MLYDRRSPTNSSTEVVVVLLKVIQRTPAVLIPRARRSMAWFFYQWNGTPSRRTISYETKVRTFVEARCFLFIHRVNLDPLEAVWKNKDSWKIRQMTQFFPEGFDLTIFSYISKVGPVNHLLWPLIFLRACGQRWRPNTRWDLWRSGWISWNLALRIWTMHDEGALITWPMMNMWQTFNLPSDWSRSSISK